MHPVKDASNLSIVNFSPFFIYLFIYLFIKKSFWTPLPPPPFLTQHPRHSLPQLLSRHLFTQFLSPPSPSQQANRHSFFFFFFLPNRNQHTQNNKLTLRKINTKKKIKKNMEAPDFFVEDLLDLPGGDDIMTDAFFSSPTNKNTTDSSSPTAVDSCNSSISGVNNNYAAGDHCRGGCRSTVTHTQFSGELCVPYDDLAELEWLSNFVEESFSSEDLHELQFIPGPNDGGPPTYHQQFRPQSDSTRPNPLFRPDTMVPGKARSKLSRVAPSDWSTRLVMVTPTTTAAAATSSSGTTDTVVSLHNPKKTSKRRDSSASDSTSDNGGVRRCLHCAAEKTPQWRTGPMGAKTLCNACGVRYKSGRLVPEYRPAASPTFVSARHSNSHRKVLELRRQKDMLPGQGHHQQPVLSHNGGVLGMSNCDHDYLIRRRHMGPDYRQMI